MLLGAGRGTRLRPLTESLPKPLVPVGRQPLLDRHLQSLASLGIDDVALNVSHLAERIVNHAHGGDGPRPTLLREERPAGIGGGLLRARALLERHERFLLINTDIWHTVDLESALDLHRRSDADAVLVVLRPERDGDTDELSIDRDGFVTRVPGMGAARRGGGRWRFSGIHVLTPAIFEHLSDPGGIFPGYASLLAAGAKVVAFDCTGADWVDVGTPAGYLRANHIAIRRAPTRGPLNRTTEAQHPISVAPSARIGDNCRVGPESAIGDQASIGPGSRIVESVVWPGVSVPPGSRLRRCVAYGDGILEVTDGPS